MKLDRYQILGMILLFGIFLLWSTLNMPSKEEIAERQRVQDSIALAQQAALEPQQTTESSTVLPDTSGNAVPDSIRQEQMRAQYGSLSSAMQGEETFYTLENENLLITFSNKGGRITDVLLKKYEKILLDEERKEYKVPLHFMDDTKNKFDFLLPIGNKTVKSGDLFFTAIPSNNKIEFTVTGADGVVFGQTYTLAPDGHALDYDLTFGNLAPSTDKVRLSWENHLDKLEKNWTYERYYSSVYYRESEDDSPDYCNCRRSDTDELNSKSLKWVSHANQFFNTSLIADAKFNGVLMSTEMLDDSSPDLKILRSEIDIPLAGSGTQNIGMTMYIGPNDFEELRSFHVALEDVIPFGRSILGTINRWVIRPIFNVLSSFISNKGLVILFLTFVVKIVLYPLTYKMLHSQAKMSALKPQMAGLREKHKDDMQKQQMETMKVYREYGVSPLGGCLPMVAQMPIWIALYRFFPASIEFRQAKFLWATDLSSYDVFINLPWDVPVYGGHISLLTLLWAGTTVLYTYYNMRNMDMGAMGGNPMLKYMQYFMPVMFLFFFNNYASGLTLYLLFSNIINIGLTLGTKEFIFDEEKIREELNLNKAKPKKRSGFSQRLEQAMKEQQRIADQRNKERAKK